MAAITAQMVKELRGKTGAGMMDCKKALSESDGDVEGAIDWLRTKGLASAAKKSGRVAAEGKVITASEGGRGVMIELNIETDFATKNEGFIAFGDKVAGLALAQSVADLDGLKGLDYPEAGHDVAAELKNQIASIGENMDLRRYAKLEVSSGVVSSYIHMGGKIGVLVALESNVSDLEALDVLGRKVAMHVAAANPPYLNRDDVSADALAREKAVLSEQARASGKPDNIIEKMVIGRLNKFYGEVCLLDQAYVMEPDLTVSKALQAEAKTLGGEVKVTGFVRFGLGEGVEKKEEDFAAEVAKQMEG